MDFLDQTLGWTALNTEQSHHQDPGDKHWHLAGKEWTWVPCKVTNFNPEEIVLLPESWKFAPNLPKLNNILKQMVQLPLPRQFPREAQPSSTATTARAQTWWSTAFHTFTRDTCPEQGRIWYVLGLFQKFPHRCCQWQLTCTTAPGQTALPAAPSAPHQQPARLTERQNWVRKL